MRRVDAETLALKIAEALLLHKGELSIQDIEAIPFLNDSNDAQLIARYLRSKYKTRISTLRTQSQRINDWEELITLIR